MPSNPASRIPGLERSDFGLPPDPYDRLIILNMGLTKTAKSTFPFFGPGPITVFDFDRRLERVVQKAINGEPPFAEPKEIVWLPFEMPKIDIRSRDADKTAQREAEALIAKFDKNFLYALDSSEKKGGVRTISVDTGTELQDLRKIAEFGRLVGIQPRDLGGVNQYMRDHMRRGENYSANICWVHHVKDEWGRIDKGNGKEDQAPTGRKIIDGYNKADQCVQVILMHGVRGSEFTIEVVGSGLNPKTNGKVYRSRDEDWKDLGPFAYVALDQIPESDEKSWLD